MFAVIALVSSLGLGNPTCELEPVAAPVIQHALEEARQDFEMRFSELGLLGAAPLPGTERASGL